MKYRVMETIKNEFNSWDFETEADAQKKLSEVISYNEKQGRRLVTSLEWNNAERKAAQNKMFMADMEEAEEE